MQRWASWRGVPFDLARKFPQRTIAAQRLCIVAAAEGWQTGIGIAIALARAMWADQRDLEDPAVLRAILDEAAIAGETAERWFAQIQEPAIKAQLAANTSEAQAAGAFGVPTFLVDGSQLFWGQDRLDLVAAALVEVAP
jgi:2-hydroxychromene-2-carboxylate isomerase